MMKFQIDGSNLAVGYIQKSITMKTRIIIILIVGSFLFQACTRSMSPYEAANNPRGKKCGTIR